MLPGENLSLNTDTGPMLGRLTLWVLSGFGVTLSWAIGHMLYEGSFYVLGQAAPSSGIDISGGAIGGALASGGSITINALIIHWFLKYVRDAHDGSEKRITDLLLAHKQEIAEMKERHREELKRRDDEHMSDLKTLLEEQKEMSTQNRETMKEVVVTLARLQVNAAIELKNAGQHARQAGSSNIHEHHPKQ